jgi:hypothetical protein
VCAAIGAAPLGGQRSIIQQAFDNGRYAAWEAAVEAIRDASVRLDLPLHRDALKGGHKAIAELMDSVRAYAVDAMGAVSKGGGESTASCIWVDQEEYEQCPITSVASSAAAGTRRGRPGGCWRTGVQAGAERAPPGI